MEQVIGICSHIVYNSLSLAGKMVSVMGIFLSRNQQMWQYCGAIARKEETRGHGEELVRL